MGVVDTSLEKLPRSERVEIESIVAAAIAARPKDTDRFVSDEGDTMAWHLLAFVAALGGFVSALLIWANAPRGLIVPTSFAGLANHPTVPGILVTVPVLLYTITTFLRVHKRHGWMATTFGVVRLRGQAVRLLRYDQITHAVRRRIQAGRRPFSVLELVARDGTTMTTYATRLMDTIQARVPATAVNEGHPGSGSNQ
ncbi:MAG: hypothetical protein Q8P41_28200 [Pseudomonadota bacterium]|nr:hypothetical protein [Pseudomonadota bacterium]